MAREIEKKYRITDQLRRQVVESLREFRAHFEGSEFEENTIYTGETAPANGGVVRVRRTNNRALLTFKRRVENGSDLKEQIEYETEISDPESVHAILSELGLRPQLVYEKRRDTWRLRDAEVVLDELPFGLFMEIEGSVTAIREAEMLLDADQFEVEPLTYPRLTADLGTPNGGMVEARFPAEKSTDR